MTSSEASKKVPPESTLPSSLKRSPRGRGTGFSKQEMLFLAKAYIRGSTDPVIGTSQSKETFYGKVCTIYNQIVACWNKGNEDGECRHLSLSG